MKKRRSANYKYTLYEHITHSRGFLALPLFVVLYLLQRLDKVFVIHSHCYFTKIAFEPAP
jgi:hypothetical protein